MFQFESKAGKWNLSIGDLVMFKFSDKKTLAGIVESIKTNKVHVRVKGKDENDNIQMVVRRKLIISGIKQSEKK